MCSLHKHYIWERAQRALLCGNPFPWSGLLLHCTPTWIHWRAEELTISPNLWLWSTLFFNYFNNKPKTFSAIFFFKKASYLLSATRKLTSDKSLMRQEIKYGAVLYTVQLMRRTHVHMCTCSKEEKYIYILRERTHKKERKKKEKQIWITNAWRSGTGGL